MRTRTFTALLVLVLTLGLTFVPNIFAAKAQGFLSVQGTRIVDSSGRPVLLRGVNYPGYESGSADSKLHTESAYEMFARSGFNVVRLPISWGNLEPYPGAFYESYLTRYVDRDIRWAKKYGIYIILDMHQFNWASRFGGNGVPDWAVTQFPPTQNGMLQAVSEFWNNTALQDHLTNVWTKVALRYAKEPTVAGYDILNEPWIYNSVIPNLNASHVDSFYVKVIESIRAVDSNHSIFLEPANVHANSFPLKDKIVWSPHFYPLSFAPHYHPLNITVLRADLDAKYKTFVIEMGSPMWIGEFGAFMQDASSEQWLRDAVALFNEYQVGWAWWAYSRSRGGLTFTNLMKAFDLSMTRSFSTNVSSQPVRESKLNSRIAQLNSSTTDQPTPIVPWNAYNALLLSIALIATSVIASSPALRRCSAIYQPRMKPAVSDF
jgi:endoglycosylceramidase